MNLNTCRLVESNILFSHGYWIVATTGTVYSQDLNIPGAVPCLQQSQYRETKRQQHCIVQQGSLFVWKSSAWGTICFSSYCSTSHVGWQWQPERLGPLGTKVFATGLDNEALREWWLKWLSNIVTLTRVDPIWSYNTVTSEDLCSKHPYNSVSFRIYLLRSLCIRYLLISFCDLVRLVPTNVHDNHRKRRVLVLVISIQMCTSSNKRPYLNVAPLPLVMVRWIPVPNILNPSIMIARLGPFPSCGFILEIQGAALPRASNTGPLGGSSIYYTVGQWFDSHVYHS